MSFRTVAGILLVLLGLGALLDAMGRIEFWSGFGTYWPVLLIVIGVVQLLQGRGRWLGPVVLIGLGAFFLADNVDVLPDRWDRYVWPVILMAVGLLLLLGARRRHRRTEGEAWRTVAGTGHTTTTETDTVRRLALFGGAEERIASRAFRSADVMAMFGGIDLDLLDAQLAPDAHVTATALFGGIQLYVPKGTNVQVRGTPVFGGFSSTVEGAPDGPTLVVDGVAIFGGVDVSDHRKER